MRSHLSVILSTTPVLTQFQSFWVTYWGGSWSISVEFCAEWVIWIWFYSTTNRCPGAFSSEFFFCHIKKKNTQEVLIAWTYVWIFYSVPLIYVFFSCASTMMFLLPWLCSITRHQVYCFLQYCSFHSVLLWQFLFFVVVCLFLCAWFCMNFKIVFLFLMKKFAEILIGITLNL